MALLFTQQASAACTKLAFSVNDYGKDGPTKDAKDLLDKYIAKWMSDRSIKTYKTGPKEVTCELFLDFIVFDEYTCKAAANVCWDGPLPPGHTVDASAQGPVLNKAAQKSSPAAKPAPKAADGTTSAPVTTGSVRQSPSATPAAARAPATATTGSASSAAPTAAPAKPAASPPAN